MYIANESTRRLVEDGMSTGLKNTHTARGFSVLHYVIKVTLHYLMLHRFEVHSALELSRTALLGCSLAINKKLKEHLNLVGFRAGPAVSLFRIVHCCFQDPVLLIARGDEWKTKQNNRPA